MYITGYRLNLRTAGIAALILGAILWLWFAFGTPSQEFDIFQSSNSTKTAIALTSNALMGPFPTSTAPTYTPTAIPTITSTLPSPTPTATRTPTPTSTFPATATLPLRTREPGSITASVLTSAPPTSTRVRPTNTSFSPPNTSVPPTNIPPTQPPPTQPPPPPPTFIIPLPTLPPLIETLLPFP